MEDDRKNTINSTFTVHLLVSICRIIRTYHTLIELSGNQQLHWYDNICYEPRFHAEDSLVDQKTATLSPNVNMRLHQDFDLIIWYHQKMKSSSKACQRWPLTKSSNTRCHHLQAQYQCNAHFVNTFKSTLSIKAKSQFRLCIVYLLPEALQCAFNLMINA